MSRYTSATDADRQEMLEAIGVDTIDDLFADVPEGVRLGRVRVRRNDVIRGAAAAMAFVAALAALARRSRGGRA